MSLLHEELTEKVIGVCFEVSNELGSGFLESAYQKALTVALTQKGLTIEEQVPLKVKFRGHVVGDFYADILINSKLILEPKSTKSISPEHEAQMINYLKASGLNVGLIINFGRTKLEWKRLVF